jgi:hypothetical protein
LFPVATVRILAGYFAPRPAAIGTILPFVSRNIKHKRSVAKNNCVAEKLPVVTGSSRHEAVLRGSEYNALKQMSTKIISVAAKQQLVTYGK